MPAESVSVKARYWPGCLLVASAMEKSRMWSSWICALLKGTGAGLRRSRQPGGASFGSARSTARLYVESVVRAVE